MIPIKQLPQFLAYVLMIWHPSEKEIEEEEPNTSMAGWLRFAKDIPWGSNTLADDTYFTYEQMVAMRGNPKEQQVFVQDLHIALHNMEGTNANTYLWYVPRSLYVQATYIMRQHTNIIQVLPKLLMAFSTGSKYCNTPVRLDVHALIDLLLFADDAQAGGLFAPDLLDETLSDFHHVVHVHHGLFVGEALSSHGIGHFAKKGPWKVLGIHRQGQLRKLVLRSDAPVVEYGTEQDVIKTSHGVTPRQMAVVADHLEDTPHPVELHEIYANSIASNVTGGALGLVVQLGCGSSEVTLTAYRDKADFAVFEMHLDMQGTG